MGKKKKTLINEIEFQAAFAKRLKYLRKEKTDLSAEAFAYEVDISRALYSKYEKTGANITARNMIKIFNGLDISFAEFFSEGF